MLNAGEQEEVLEALVPMLQEVVAVELMRPVE
jgi:hypothetical protein